MKRQILLITTPLVCLILAASCASGVLGQSSPANKALPGNKILTPGQLDQLMARPKPLEGYFSNQSGPLTRIDSTGKEFTDSTFTVEKIKIPSDGLMINGWLYLPLGEGRFPLVVLTNGGGNNVRAIKSLSDWIAPVFAHCGIAAFVHDKRGTGESDGEYAKTTYEDYIRDAGNCGSWLLKHPRIDPAHIGTMGGSEGGRIAVIAAHRYPVFSFVISLAGTVVSPIEDRLNAQLNGMIDQGVLNDSLLPLVRPLWEKSFRAWASNDPDEHSMVDSEIRDWRKKFDQRILPFTKTEMDTIPGFEVILPTWNSLGFDYMSEMEHFKKPWLAIFGEVDRVVPTEASVKNILRYMELSGNDNYNIAIIPKCGHAPVNVETRRLVRIDHLAVNWLNENILAQHPENRNI
jgi:hypothetical protein